MVVDSQSRHWWLHVLSEMINITKTEKDALLYKISNYESIFLIHSPFDRHKIV